MEKSVTFHIITLKWEKAWFSIEDNDKIPKQSGVYQIYGDSPLYGINTLLYIGKASNLHDRIVGGHLRNEVSFITRQANKSIRYALVSEDNLNIVEETLIVMHKPSFNSSSLIDISEKTKSKGVYIQNHGERGMLQLEVTNYYFLHPNHNKNIRLEVSTHDN